MAAATITLLLGGLAYLIGTARDGLVAALRASTTQVTRWSGMVLIGVGLWLVALAIWAEQFARFFPV